MKRARSRTRRSKTDDEQRMDAMILEEEKREAEEVADLTQRLRKRARYDITSALQLVNTHSVTMEGVIEWVEDLPPEIWTNTLFAGAMQRLDFEFVTRIVKLGNKTLYEYTKDVRLWRYLYESMLISPASREPLSERSLLELVNMAQQDTTMGKLGAGLRAESERHFWLMHQYVTQFGERPTDPYAGTTLTKGNVGTRVTPHISVLLHTDALRSTTVHIPTWRIWKRMAEVHRRRRNHILDLGERVTPYDRLDPTLTTAKHRGELAEPTNIQYATGMRGDIVTMDDNPVDQVQPMERRPMAMKTSLVNHVPDIHEAMHSDDYTYTITASMRLLKEIQNQQFYMTEGRFTYDHSSHIDLPGFPWPVFMSTTYEFMMRLPNNICIKFEFDDQMIGMFMNRRVPTVNIQWLLANTRVSHISKYNLLFIYPQVCYIDDIFHIVFKIAVVDISSLVSLAVYIESNIPMQPSKDESVYTIDYTDNVFFDITPQILFTCNLKQLEPDSKKLSRPPLFGSRGELLSRVFKEGNQYLPWSTTVHENRVYFGYAHGLQAMQLTLYLPNPDPGVVVRKLAFPDKDVEIKFLPFVRWEDLLTTNVSPMAHMHLSADDNARELKNLADIAVKLHSSATIRYPEMDDAEEEFFRDNIYPPIPEDSKHTFADHVEVCVNPSDPTKLVIVLGVMGLGELCTIINKDAYILEQERLIPHFNEERDIYEVPMHYYVLGADMVHLTDPSKPNLIQTIYERSTIVTLDSNEEHFFNAFLRSQIDSVAVILPAHRTKTISVIDEDEIVYERRLVENAIDIMAVPWIDVSPEWRYCIPPFLLRRVKTTPYVLQTICLPWTYQVTGTIVLGQAEIVDRSRNFEIEPIDRINTRLIFILSPRNGWRSVVNQSVVESITSDPYEYEPGLPYTPPSLNSGLRLKNISIMRVFQTVVALDQTGSVPGLVNMSAINELSIRKLSMSMATTFGIIYVKYMYTYTNDNGDEHRRYRLAQVSHQFADYEMGPNFNNSIIPKVNPGTRPTILSSLPIQRPFVDDDNERLPLNSPLKAIDFATTMGCRFG